MSQDAPKTPLLSADHPRTEPREDLLGYAPFAKMLAHSVLRGSPSAGLVVGIYGEWGLGKTTLLNFIEHFTQSDADDEPPVIVRFNPWWFSGREDLLRRFFADFESAVLKKRAKNTKLRSALQKFGDAIGNVPFAWVGGVGKIVAAATKLGQPSDVVGLKRAIVDALAEEVLRVIVLVNDINRLLPSEMVDVFRLVRSVGDFPNVHYVLALDHDIVTTAISTECHTDGARYLEKIVQAPFDLPRPSAATLRGLFAHRLPEILGEVDSALLDPKYWMDVFVHGISPFLRTPRDVGRLLNSIAVIYPSLRGEVNVVDFIGVETLRVFAPDAYEIIRSNPQRFVGMLLAVDHLKEQHRQFHEEWLATVKRDAHTTRALVTRLFPSVAGVLGARNSPAPRDGTLRKARRVCVENVFDVYFRYAIERGVSRSEFLSTLSLSGEPLSNKLRRLVSERTDDGHTKLRAFLEMLQDELDGGATRVNVAEWLAQLAAVGDAAVSGTPPSFDFTTPDDFLLVFVMEKLLETLPAEDRASALTTALRSAGVSITGMIVGFIGGQHGRHGGQSSIPEERTIPVEGDVDGLEEYARKRIASASGDGSLWAAPRLIRTLFDWKRFGGEADMRAAVERWCSNDENLVGLLSQLRGISGRGTDTVNIADATTLLDLDATIPRARVLLRLPTTTGPARTILQLFVDAYDSTAEARTEARTRNKILGGILGDIAAAGWYPKEAKVRKDFERDGRMIDQLLSERLIATVQNDRFMIRLAGLRAVKWIPQAGRELDICAALHERLRAAYRSDERTVDLGVAANESTKEGSSCDVNNYRRAAIVLLLAGCKFTVEKWTDEGMPESVTVKDGILDLLGEEDAPKETGPSGV